MGHPIITTVTLAAASANGIATSQALAAAGALVLNGTSVSGGIATLDAPRRILITSAGNDSGINFTITGKARPEQGGVIQSETIKGGNAVAVATTQDFATVTSIVASGAVATTVTAGTNGTGSGPWVPWDTQTVDFQVSVFGAVVSGNPTYQLDYTYDDVFGTWLPAGVPFPRALTSGTLVGLTGNAEGALTNPIRASRLTLTAVGGAQLTQQQQGT